MLNLAIAKKSNKHLVVKEIELFKQEDVINKGRQHTFEFMISIDF